MSLLPKNMSIFKINPYYSKEPPQNGHAYFGTKVSTNLVSNYKFRLKFRQRKCAKSLPKNVSILCSFCPLIDDTSPAPPPEKTETLRY